MVTYIDTSVIIAAVDRGDGRNRDAERFLLREEGKVISPLVLTEVFSAVSRIPDLKLELDIDKRDLPAVIARLAVRKYGLDVIAPPHRSFTIFGELPSEYKRAFLLAPELKLRTLDLLHISYAWNLKMNGKNIEKFATFDEEILRKSDKIKELTDIRVIEP